MTFDKRTIYSGWDWDDILSSAVLAQALLRKGFKIFLEFPSPQELRNLIINKAYSVGISHKDGVRLINSTSLQYITEKRLGLVLRYDDGGRPSTIMRFANVNTLTEVALEYVQTLNEYVDVPKQLLEDVAFMSSGRLDKLSRIGRIMHRALKMNYGNKEFRSIMYNFVFNAIATKSLKIPEALIREAGKYDEAIKIARKLLKEERYVTTDNIKVLVISSKYDDELVRENISLLKPVAYDTLLKVCRTDGVAMLILETGLGHTLRVCLNRRDISFVNIVKSIPREASSKLIITMRGNHIIVKFRKPSESTLNAVLDIALSMARGVTPSRA